MSWGWLSAIVLVGAAVLGPAGWIATDWLEQDNDFCNACHLPQGTPLHIDIRRDFDARPPATLAALHAASRVEARPSDPAFRCIDCHGGVGPVGRTRVKILAAKDAFWWLVGHFEEPDGMNWPLVDADCAQCHARFEPGDDLERPDFHDLSVHNTDLGVACVSCHGSHDAGGDPDYQFIDAAHVRAQCARCHVEFEEGGS